MPESCSSYRARQGWSCQRKVAYPSLQKAMAEAVRLNMEVLGPGARPREYNAPYRCPDCGEWHNGRRQKTTKVAAARLLTGEESPAEKWRKRDAYERHVAAVEEAARERREVERWEGEGGLIVHRSRRDRLKFARYRLKKEALACQEGGGEDAD